MKYLSLFAALLVFTNITNITTAATNKSLKGSRPNIILVMTDDQGLGDLSCMGNQVLRTPNLDKFHAIATRFTDFHVSPTCAPTRSAIMSGRHEFRNGVTHTILERDRMALSTTTLPQLLHAAGYETGIFGKWHLGDEEQYQPTSRGFSEVLTHGAGGIGQNFPGSQADFAPNANKETRYFDTVVRHNNTVVQTKGFCTDVFFETALGWIKQKRDAGQPHFAYISTNAPHGPMIAPSEYKKRFADLGWDANKTQGRYGMIENIDANFGQLMKKLDEWNAWDDTLVIFMTDNGQAGSSGTLNGKKTRWHTAGFKTGKGSPYEGGTHVPAFWRWKGVLGEGVDIPALTAHVDLFDTLCEIAGAKIPADIQMRDGRSMVPLLENPNAKWKDRQLFIHVGRWPTGQDPNKSKFKNCAIRTTRWRFVNNSLLYDIAADPYETTNVADQHPQVLAKLRKDYDLWWEATVPLMVNEGVEFLDYKPLHRMYDAQLKKGGIPQWTPLKF